jgi:hypothetical protein
MQNLPPFVYARAFWEALSLAVAGLLGLLAFLGYVDASWAVPATVILTWILGFLRMFNIEPELRERLLDQKLKRAEALLAEASRVRNDMLDYKKSAKSSKK